MKLKKTKLTLYVTDEVIQQMKIHAVREKRSLSEITEGLYASYLKRGKPKR